jgi:hypothetical protein
MVLQRSTLSFGGHGGCCGDDIALDMMLRGGVPTATARLEDNLFVSRHAVREIVGKFIVQQAAVRYACTTRHQLQKVSLNT